MYIQVKNQLLNPMSDSKNNSYIFLISFIAALGGLLFGFDIAIISGTVPFIKDYFQLTEIELGWGVGALLVGCIPGAMIAGKLADRYGRKKVLIFIAILFTLTSILTAVASDFNFFVIARLIGGFAVGATSVISPLYIAEIAPAHMRGKLVSLNQLTITIGIFASYFINFLLHDIGPDNWRWMFASGAAPAIVFFGLLFLVPESPRWLFANNKGLDALRILERIGVAKNKAIELGELSSEQNNVKSMILELFSSRYRRPAIVGIVLAIFVQISGINTIIDYAPIILKAAGNPLDTALFQTFIIGFINFAFTFVAIFTIDKVGRKPLYVIGAAGMTISLALLGLGFLVGFAEGIVGLVLILFFIAFFAAFIGPVFWVLMSELFPEQIRGTAISIAVFTNWLTNFIVVLFFPYVLKNAGGAATFFFLAFMALLMLIFTKKFVPETKGKTLEEIDQQWRALKQ